jgi:hypothetical protein
MTDAFERKQLGNILDELKKYDPVHHTPEETTEFHYFIEDEIRAILEPERPICPRRVSCPHSKRVVAAGQVRAACNRRGIFQYACPFADGAKG